MVPGNMTRPWENVATVPTAEGALELRRRGADEFLIVISGRVLMTNANRRSEQALATLACAALGRHPRTAVGVSRDGHTVFLVVVDGRRGGSRGLNLYELADFLADIGAHDAVNLDGGGSSAMYLRRAGGVINAPSGGRWEARAGFGADEVEVAERNSDGERRVYVRGVEREVMNHLGVVAPEPPPIASNSHSVLDVPVAAGAAVVLPPRQSPFRFGRLRESLRWVLPLGAGLLMASVWVVRRKRRGAPLLPRRQVG